MMPRWWELWEERQKENTVKVGITIPLNRLKRWWSGIFCRTKRAREARRRTGR